MPLVAVATSLMNPHATASFLGHFIVPSLFLSSHSLSASLINDAPRSSTVDLLLAHLHLPFATTSIPHLTLVSPLAACGHFCPPWYLDHVLLASPALSLLLSLPPIFKRPLSRLIELVHLLTLQRLMYRFRLANVSLRFLIRMSSSVYIVPMPTVASSRYVDRGYHSRVTLSDADKDFRCLSCTDRSLNHLACTVQLQYSRSTSMLV